MDYQKIEMTFNLKRMEYNVGLMEHLVHTKPTKSLTFCAMDVIRVG
jgi:hypothetical protein